MRFLQLFGVLILLLFVQPVFGHEQDKESFVLINGVYTEHNLIPVPAYEGMSVAHEITGQSYPVIQPITFKVDRNKVGQSIGLMLQTQFSWDFGDGNGLKNGDEQTYYYQKPGSYIVKIFRQLQENEKELISSVAVNVIPMPRYVLPTALIQVNNEVVDQKIYHSFAKVLLFDSNKSEASAAGIKEVLWSLGDGQFRRDNEFSYQFDSKHYNSFVILRVIDKTGLSADRFVEIINSDRVEHLENKNSAIQQKIFSNSLLTGIIGGVLLLGFIVFVWYKRSR